VRTSGGGEKDRGKKGAGPRFPLKGKSVRIHKRVLKTGRRKGRATISSGREASVLRMGKDWMDAKRDIEGGGRNKTKKKPKLVGAEYSPQS